MGVLRLASFISGGGTTMQVIAKECYEGSLKGVVKLSVVIASCDCEGIKKARKFSIPSYIVARSNFPKGAEGRISFGKTLLSILREAEIDLITQNGWLPLTPANVVASYKERIFNQHPGPLDPPFADFGGKGMYGLRVHSAILYFQKLTKRTFPTEASVQKVAEDFDRGNLLLTEPVKILKSDTPETLAKRVLPYEHKLQIKLLKQFVQKNLKELKRQTRLIKKGEEEKLILAKRKAIAKYKYG